MYVVWSIILGILCYIAFFHSPVGEKEKDRWAIFQASLIVSITMMVVFH